MMVVFIIGMTPAFAAEVSLASQTVDPMNVKGKGVDVEAVSEVLEQSSSGQLPLWDNETSNTTTEATTTTTESSATTETGETIEGIDIQPPTEIIPEINTTGIVMQTTNYTCGPAALATVLNNMEINATEQELMNFAGTDESGTTMYGLAEAAEA